MNSLRIAMIVPGLGKVQRGAETAFLEVAMGLQAYSDVEVKLFGRGADVPGGLPISAIACRPREQFENWPKLPFFRTECYYEEFAFVRQLKRSQLFDPNQFDAVISCTYPYINWFVQRAQKVNKNLLNIFVTQNGDWMCRAGNREYRYFKCDGLVAINPDYFAGNKQNYDTVLIPNGTDPDMFVPRSEVSDTESLECCADLPSDKTIVLMVSALIPSKRVAAGVRSAAQVEDAFLLVAGDGPERDRIAALADELMPGRYRLLGSVQREQMPALFRQADIFLHMSQVEPFGIVYLEAAASGLPIVTHDGDTPRWILGDTALYADSNNPTDVADAIRSAVDPEFRTTIGQAARQRVIAGWTWKAQAAKYRDFIITKLGYPTEKEGNDVVDRDRQLQHV